MINMLINQHVNNKCTLIVLMKNDMHFSYRPSDRPTYGAFRLQYIVIGLIKVYCTNYAYTLVFYYVRRHLHEHINYCQSLLILSTKVLLLKVRAYCVLAIVIALVTCKKNRSSEM